MLATAPRPVNHDDSPSYCTPDLVTADVHDSDVCGLSYPGPEPLCPGCRMADRMTSALGEELQSIRERFEAADKRLHHSQVHANVAGAEAAEGERREALGDHYAAAAVLSDLGLLLLRYAAEYLPESLRTTLREILREDFADIIRAAARKGKHR